MSKKPVMLCIMDGFGWTPDETYGNAVAAANKPNLDKIFANYPMTTIQASGLAGRPPHAPNGHLPTARWATLRSATPTWARAVSSTSS